MNNNLFREKSITRVSSPEQLNDRIRVANPSVWMILAGVILILLGIFVWGIFGRLDTLISVGAITENGQTICYIKEADVERIRTEMTVRAEGEEYAIAEISSMPIQVGGALPEYLCHIGGLNAGEWVYAVWLNEPCGDNGSIFRADIVIESIAPMSFVVN